MTQKQRKISDRPLTIAALTVFAVNTAYIIYHLYHYGFYTGDSGYVEPDTGVLVGFSLLAMAIICIASLLLSLIIALFSNREVQYAIRLKRVFLWVLAIVNLLMLFNILLESL
ncbi:hypothetical protein [Flavobacterium sp.]